MPATAPTVSPQVGAVMAVYNYSIQNVIARTLKFVASYYDWIWCQNQIYSSNTSDAPVDGPLPLPQDQVYCEPASLDPNKDSTGGLLVSDYLPPASLFTQFSQIINFGLTVTAQSNLSDCLCSNLCGILQILVGLDSNKGIREFILNHAFGGDGNDSKRMAGGGHLYDEESYSKKYGGAVISIVELIIEVAKSLDAVDNPERAEAVLKKICRCIISAAAKGKCYCPSNDPGAPPANEKTGYDVQYQAQFYAMVVDWVQFIHFDRDCRKFADDKCECCPAPPSVEQWLEQRCKFGTGDGQCLVFTGACSKYRRSDDFKPMLSSLFAIKHYVGLLTVARDGNYQHRVSKRYQDIVNDFSGIYGSGEVTFYPDCAAPQFCCSSELHTYDTACHLRCDETCCPPRPVPELDTRKVYVPCVDPRAPPESSEPEEELARAGYTPEICGKQAPCVGTDTGADCGVPYVPAAALNCLRANPCVILPIPNQQSVVQCDRNCCDNLLGDFQ
jgi:hypothetical protein